MIGLAHFAELEPLYTLHRKHLIQKAPVLNKRFGTKLHTAWSYDWQFYMMHGLLPSAHVLCSFLQSNDHHQHAVPPSTCNLHHTVVHAHSVGHHLTGTVSYTQLPILVPAPSICQTSLASDQSVPGTTTHLRHASTFGAKASYRLTISSQLYTLRVHV